jgi:thymidylate synthase (FAD)
MAEFERKSMRVSLVAQTQPLFIEGVATLGEFLAYTARVSNPSNQLNSETAPRLLAYCLKAGHWSVFEAASMTMEIVTSVSISIQILRHRSFTFQQFSQRYAEATEFETYEARSQDPKNRQNSIDDMEQETKDWFLEAQYNVQQDSMRRYREALELGIAKEQARFLLPGGTQTTLYMTGSIRSWIHYCETRTKPGVQKEHRDIALRCLDILLEAVPELLGYFHAVIR